MEINLLDLYPVSKRPIDQRAALVTEAHRRTAREFGAEFFDGDRLNGYGGYSYHPRFWTDTVRRIRDHYQLAQSASVLDVGCAKGFMMYDFKLLMPHMDIRGIDISRYAHDHAKPEMKPFMEVASARDLPFDDDSFDLVICINTIHNLPLGDCTRAVREIQRVSRQHAFIVNDAWHNPAEQQAMESWNLTALTTLHVDDWKKLYADNGYTGDYGWFIAESS
ncbi:MAG TPA: class I SAM-dependent methyltransferase [Rhodospirillales bacterium]|nr:class I SAM-dependent methyltransferase [Rhodospirillales bacterium]